MEITNTEQSGERTLTFEYREDEYSETFEAASFSEAKKLAADKCRQGDYGNVTETFWVECYVAQLDEDGEPVKEDWINVEFDPEEPDCPEGEHDWQSPWEIVGGIKENPGVWGKGGGVVINECCMHCGCKRTTDTWAQNPSNGEQGLTSVSYEVGFYDLPEDEEE